MIKDVEGKRAVKIQETKMPGMTAIRYTPVQAKVKIGQINKDILKLKTLLKTMIDSHKKHSKLIGKDLDYSELVKVDKVCGFKNSDFEFFASDEMLSEMIKIAIESKKQEIKDVRVRTRKRL